MGYKVAIVGPSGRKTYLRRGKEIESAAQATWYPHPSNAERAADSHRKRLGRQSVLVYVENWVTREEVQEP